MAYNPPQAAAIDTPASDDIRFGTGNAVGTVNPGDYLVYSGYSVVPTAMAAGNAAAVKASAAGIALEASPVYDSFGNSKTNTALLFLQQGHLRVSAHNNGSASGEILLGVPVYPATTGSGVAAPTGLTGVGSRWATAAHSTVSGGTAGVALGIGRIVGIAQFGTGSGTTKLDIFVYPPRPDYV